MKPATLWPVTIVAVLCLTVAANVAVLMRAGGREDAPLEPDYYRKAVAWDSTLAQQARNEALGWRLDATLSDRAGDRRRLAVRLVDRAGVPIADAAIAVDAIHNRLPDPIRARLTATPRGYEARLLLVRDGRWELRFDVTRGEARFTRTVRLETGLPSTIAGARSADGSGS